MSKINDLIQELCPNGVIFKKLDEACTKIYAGGTPSTSHEEYYGGNIKWLRSGEINFNELYDTEIKITDVGLNNSSAKIIPSHSVVIAMTGATVARTAMIMEDMSMNQSVCALIPKDELNYRFLYQLLSNKYLELKQSGQGVLTSLNLNRIKKITIPVPPIEVQEEIVKILDKFGDLEAELEAELEARKNQYDFWREKLCGGEISSLKEQAKKGTIKLNKLNEVGTLTRGKRFVKADAVESGASCIHYGELYTYYGISAIKTKSYIREELANKLRFAEKGDVVIVGAGENDIDIGIGVAWLGDEKPAIHDACYIFKHSLNPKYVSYYLRTKLYHNQLKSWVSEGKICAISAKGIGECFMPIPTIEKQNEIVKILDKFEKLINDISVGIPAEIELRRKQYEYYRNKLLSFEELSVSE